MPNGIHPEADDKSAEIRNLKQRVADLEEALEELYEVVKRRLLSYERIVGRGHK